MYEKYIDHIHPPSPSLFSLISPTATHPQMGPVLPYCPSLFFNCALIVQGGLHIRFLYVKIGDKI
jgi:hypothetical protein